MNRFKGKYDDYKPIAKAMVYLLHAHIENQFNCTNIDFANVKRIIYSKELLKD